MRNKTWIVLCLMFALALPGVAQEEPAAAASGWSQDDPPIWKLSEKPPLLYRDETPEQRTARIGLEVDPGVDPDPTKVWTRKDHDWHIEKYPRRKAIYRGQPKGQVRPHPNVTAVFEIYQEDEEWVWVWVEVPDPSVPAAGGIVADLVAPMEEPPPPPVVHPLDDKQNAKTVILNEEGRVFLTALTREFSEVILPSSGVTLRFEESSEGLPTRGSWRNGLDVADMDGDGYLDIVVPPQRGGNSFPVIFRGTPEGRWEPWMEATWPVGFNYGTVAVGDLNGDGHMDIVGGAHLLRIFALLGDGKGNFELADEGLPERFPTRRIGLADVDGDGDLDIVAISEGPTVGGEVGDVSYLRAYLNEEKGTRWREVEIAEVGRQVGGDWLTLNDFDGDGRVDVAGSSIYFSGPDVMYLQTKGGGWRPLGRGWLPFFSYYNAMTSGPFTSKKKNDVILSYRRVWPGGVKNEDFPAPPMRDITGIERVSWTGKKAPTRETILSWSSGKPVWGISQGDFNGDGHLDIVYALSGPARLAFLLGDGKGGFRTAEAEGLELPDRNLYDIHVRDVNRDGKADIILMFEKGDRSSDGSVRVWLGKGMKN